MLNLTQLLSSGPLQSNRNSLRYHKEGLPIIVWNITEACDLNCAFCYYDAKEKSNSGCLEYALVKKIVKQLRQANVQYLLLSGGEPLLYPEILRLIKELTSYSIRVGISSNGTLIDKGLASKLKKSGADYVGISLDGIKKTHNYLRKSSAAFDLAVNGIRYIKEAGLKTGVRVTLNSYNRLQLKDIFSLAEGLGVDRLCFYHLVYSGRAKGGKYDLTKRQRRKALRWIIRLAEDWIKRKVPAQVLTVDNFSDGIMLLKYIRENRPGGYAPVLELLKKQGGCPAGKRILSIDHKGILHPCQFWRSEALADLKKVNLADVLNNGARFDSWRLKLKGRCGMCSFKELCGGCRVRGYQRHRGCWGEDPSCCLTYREIKNETNILEHN